MADSESVATPMNDADAEPAPGGTTLEAAAPLKGATLDGDEGGTLASKTADAKQAVKDGASQLGTQAADKARMFAEQGKAKAGGALDQLSQMLTDAAGQVDEKLGAQYGEYARTAAGAVSDFSEQLKAKDVDALVEDARGYVRSSPAVAIGAAAAVGFVVARLIQSGFDSDQA